MEERKIAGTKPIRVQLEKGKTYHFCDCGRSDNQPFCDGSHKGTDFKPIAFSVEEDQEKAICTCKQSSKKPFCDGTHRSL